jgi:hypothetical protein
MASWWDRFGQTWAMSGLTDDQSIAQANVGWAYIGQAPPTVEQFNSVFQWNDAKDNWLYHQIANVMLDAGINPDQNYLYGLRDAINKKVKLKLYGTYSLWVDAVNGNDANNGAQGSPFRTIQHAFDWIIENIEPAGNWVVIQLIAGTHAGFTMRFPFNGTILIQGDIANQRNYLIKNDAGICAFVINGGAVLMQGISLEAVGLDSDYASAGAAIWCNGGAVMFNEISFGPCSNSHIVSTMSGNVVSWGNIHYTVYGGAVCHFNCAQGGSAGNIGCSVTIQNNPTFSLAFAVSQMGSTLNTRGSVYNGTTVGGRAWIDSNSIVNTGGVNPDTHYPGTVPAVVQRGGMYI